MVNFYSGLEQCMGDLADAVENDADAKTKAGLFRKAGEQFRRMAAHHHATAANIGKAAGFASDGDEIQPIPGISIVAEPPQGLRLIRRAGGPDVPAAPSGDDFLDKILSSVEL